MMARDHAALAALVSLAVTRATGETPVAVLAITGCVAGAALLPDFDTPDSMVARTLPPMTTWIARGVRRVSGGHRQATHGLLASATMGLAAWGLMFVHIVPTVPYPALLFGFCLYLAIYALTERIAGTGHFLALALAGLATWATWRTIGFGMWIPLAVVSGCILHLAGDALTEGGVPLFWPANRRFSMPVLGRTDSGKERAAGWVLLGLVGVLSVAPVLTLASYIR
ncbi:MAG: metal-dependent hydrolase [Acidimicrobiales bacterium]